MDTLSVKQRVRAVIALKQHEASGVPLSISEVCRLAGVNRANLYAHHQDLIEEIRNHAPGKDATRGGYQTSDQRDRRVARVPPDFERQYRALLYVCLEQQLEIRSLKTRFVLGRQVPAGRKRR